MKLQFGNPTDLTNPLNQAFYIEDTNHEQKEHVVTKCERICCFSALTIFIIVVIVVAVKEIRYSKNLKTKI